MLIKIFMTQPEIFRNFELFILSHSLPGNLPIVDRKEKINNKTEKKNLFTFFSSRHRSKFITFGLLRVFMTKNGVVK